MALVVLLRGVNVGGHRTFRPTALARELAHLDVVNIGTAGTFVVRKAVTRAQLKTEFARKLPFDTEIIVCQGRDILALLDRDDFAGHPVRPDIVRFVSVMSGPARATPEIPLQLPDTGKWLVQILATDKRFVVGVYRREMKVLRYLGMLDRVFGVPVTTRNFNTVTAIAEVLARR